MRASEHSIDYPLKFASSFIYLSNHGCSPPESICGFALFVVDLGTRLPLGAIMFLLLPLPLSSCTPTGDTAVLTLSGSRRFYRVAFLWRLTAWGRPWICCWGSWIALRDPGISEAAPLSKLKGPLPWLWFYSPDRRLLWPTTPLCLFLMPR